MFEDKNKSLGVIGVGKVVIFIFGNIVGGLINMVGGVVGVVFCGIGEMVIGVIGGFGRFFGDGIVNIEIGVEGGVVIVVKGVKDVGEWKISW